MSVWCCSHYAMAIAKLPLEEWAGEIAKLPTGCTRDCGAPRCCRERNANYLRVQYKAIKQRQQREALGARRQGALL